MEEADSEVEENDGSNKEIWICDSKTKNPFCHQHPEINFQSLNHSKSHKTLSIQVKKSFPKNPKALHLKEETFEEPTFENENENRLLKNIVKETKI